MTAPRIGILGVLPTAQPSLLRTQIPIPIPLPLPVWPSQPQRPESPPVIGDPDAWWNDDVRNLPGRIRNWFEDKTEPDWRRICYENMEKEMEKCDLVKGALGKAKANQCRAVVNTRHGECIRARSPSGVKTPFYPPGWGP